jgi:hypothetical protein
MAKTRGKVKVIGRRRLVRRSPSRAKKITSPPPIEAVQISAGSSLADGEATTPQTRYTVPAGKRLHIEYVWLGGFAPDGQILRGAVGTTVNRVIGYYTFHTPVVATTPAFRSDGDASFPVSIYADAGTDVTIWGNRTGGYSGQALVQVIVSGQLLPA